MIYPMKNKTKKQAFTLMEIVVVVVIIGVLAGILVPQYVKAREKSMNNQVIALLNTIKAAEKSYLLSYGKYYNAGYPHVTDTTTINEGLGLNLDPTNKYWDWEVAAYLNGPSTNPHYFTIYADRSSTAFSRRWMIKDDTNACCQSGCLDSDHDC